MATELYEADGWLRTGNHTACPVCRSLEVMVRWISGDPGSWEYRCPVCGAHGDATPKRPDEIGRWVQ